MNESVERIERKKLAKESDRRVGASASSKTESSCLTQNPRLSRRLYKRGFLFLANPTVVDPHGLSLCTLSLCAVRWSRPRDSFVAAIAKFVKQCFSNYFRRFLSTSFLLFDIAMTQFQNINTFSWTDNSEKW